jgi:hypothetical protein
MEGYVIERPHNQEGSALDGGYVIEKSDSWKEYKYQEYYVIERPDMEETNPLDDYVVRDESNTHRLNFMFPLG